MRKTQVKLSAGIAESVAEIVAHLKEQSHSGERSIKSTRPQNTSAIVNIESEDDGHVGTLLREIHSMAPRMGLTAEVVEDERWGDEVGAVQFRVDGKATEEDIRAQIDIVFPMACPLRKKAPKYKVVLSDDIVGILSDDLANIDLYGFISEHGGHVVGESVSLSLAEYSL